MMLPEPTQKMCRWISVIAFVMAICMSLIIVILVSQYPNDTIVRLSPELRGVNGSVSVAAYFWASIFGGWIVVICLAIANLFRILAKGDVFSQLMVRAVRRLGQVLLIYGVIGLIAPSILATLQAGKDEIVIQGTFNSQTFITILFGFTIIALSHVLSAAVEMVDENRAFV